MLIAKIVQSERENRFATLDIGRHVFGSGLNCDVVIMDNAVAESHFALLVSEQGIEIEMLDNTGCVFQCSDGLEVQLRVGDKQPWMQGDTLVLGPLTINLCGDELQTTRQSRQRSHRFLPRLKPVFSNGLRVISIPFGIILTGGVIVAVLTAAKPPLSQALIINPNKEIIEVHPKEIKTMESASVNPADLVDLDRAMLEGAKIVFQNINTKATAISVNNGVLTVGSLPKNDPERQKIINILEIDVPAIKEIKFENAQRVDLQELQNNIIAVWGGARPYVTIKEKGSVRIGEEIAEGATLIKVTSKTIIIKTENGFKELKIKK